MDEFDVHFDDARPAAEVRRQFLSVLSAPLARNGFKVSSESGDSVTFTRRYRWYKFWGERSASIVATFEPAGAGTRATISGTAPRKVRSQLEELQA